MTTIPETSCTVTSAQREPVGPGLPPSKPRIAIFSLTGCEGCSLAILELEEQLLQLLGAADIVNFREGMTERDWDIDIGFVDGAVSTPHDEENVRRYRASCKTLVAAGACACLGGVNTLKHHQPADEYREWVYGDRALMFPTAEARPVSAVVPVEYELPGCPMVKEEFLRFLLCLLNGRPFHLPTYAVCVECKRRGTLCQYEKGEICLGPVTRAGCNAICPYYGAKCEGCRGILSEEALAALGRNVHEQYDVPAEEVIASLRLYGAHQKGHIP
jgi:coenzyme F420-reducing hydrogenase gamma subunit